MTDNIFKHPISCRCKRCYNNHMADNKTLTCDQCQRRVVVDFTPPEDFPFICTDCYDRLPKRSKAGDRM